MSEEVLRQIQHKFFEVIQKKNFGNINLGDQVSEILDVTKSTAYKKIRCQTLLSADDYRRLAASFGVSLDSLVLPPQTDFMVRRPLFIQNEESLMMYLLGTAKELGRMATVEHEFLYCARDLPVFLFFSNPVLIRFKIAVWLSEFKNGLPFSKHFGFISKEVFDACKEFNKAYQLLNRKEIWSLNTLDNLRSQILYYETLGELSPQDADEVRNAVIHLMDEIPQNMKQSESDDTKWSIYGVDFLMMGSNALVLTPAQTVAYIGYAGINYLRIDQETFCEDLLHWFNKEISNGTSLVGSRKERILFFQQLKEAFVAPKTV
ncbi:MAG: hypothetical protein JJU02_01625 [Cryomorphaceae bacterium]|nr:hypothetical protein [Cryomorphaceae bacterium]